MKRICVIDGRDNTDIDLKSEISHLLNQKEETPHLDYFTLKDMNINYCTGCWDCWLKTPGICRLKDEHELILKSLVNSHHVLFVSNVRTGFISAALKKTLDRVIPCALPYIREYKGEFHHYPRYEHSPKFHIMLFAEDSPENVIKLIKDYFHRFALNFNTDVVSFATYNKKGDTANVISNM